MAALPIADNPKRGGVRLLEAHAAVSALEGVRLSDAAVYMALLWFAGPEGCFPAHQTIADQARVSLATCKRSLTRLRDLGLISWTSGRGRQGNRYRFERLELLRRPPARARSSTGGHGGDTLRRAPSEIAQSEPSKSLTLSYKPEEREPEDASLSEVGVSSDDKGAAEIAEAIDSSTGTLLEEGDDLPAKLLWIAERAGGAAEDVVAWILRRSRGRRIRSAGFWWWSREELRAAVLAGRMSREDQTARRPCSSCGAPVPADLDACGDCLWEAERRRIHG